MLFNNAADREIHHAILGNTITFTVSATTLIMWIGHRKEIWKLKFGALALHWSKSRNCGLSVVYVQKDGATLLAGAW